MLFLEELGLYETALNTVTTCLPLHLCEELIQQILLPRATTDNQVSPGCREGWEATSPGETPGGSCAKPLSYSSPSVTDVQRKNISPVVKLCVLPVWTRGSSLAFQFFEL